MRRIIVVAAVSIVMAVSGCSAGERVLAKDEVESGAKDAVTESVGQAPEDIRCPEDLAAEVGASERCTLVATDGEIGMTITVKAIDGDNATYEVEIDKQ